jgi:hypothetical protein
LRAACICSSWSPSAITPRTWPCSFWKTVESSLTGARCGGRRGLDVELIALAGERCGDAAHVIETVGQPARRGLDRRGAIGERREVLVHGPGAKLEALELRRRRRARRIEGLDGVRERREELRRELAHRCSGLLRLERGLPSVEHRLRLLEHGSPTRGGFARALCEIALLQHTGEAQPRFCQRIKRRGRAAHRGAGLQRHVLRQRCELRLLLALADQLARGATGQQQGQRREQRRPERDTHHDGQQPSGVKSIVHYPSPDPDRIQACAVRTPPPAGTADSRAGSAD